MVPPAGAPLSAAVDVVINDGRRASVALTGVVLDPVDGSALGQIGRWFSGGDQPWQPVVGGDGLALVSGVIGDDGQSALLGVIEGPGTVAFSWWVSSEQGYDFLSLEVDGAPYLRISGQSTWRTACVPVTGGEHEFLWVYDKDDTGRSGTDQGMVDEVRLIPPGQPCPEPSRGGTTATASASPLGGGGSGAVLAALATLWWGRRRAR